MSNTKTIKKSLKKLILGDGGAFVAMLSGEWGIGKTYFWHEFKENNLEEKDVVYISLFGKNTLADIETEIVTKLYKFNKGLKRYTKHLDTVGNMVSKALGLPINVSIGSLLSLFKASDFKNIVICFDDFERLSDKISLKDVMGLISQFKEQKECKIIMILNDGALSEDNQKIFSEKKEKIVDYSFYYMPSQQELFKVIKKDVKKEIKFCEPQIIKNFFEKINLKNIRIMKQALYLLKHFSFIKRNNYDQSVIDDFVRTALNLFVFKIQSNYSYEDFQEFKEYLLRVNGDYVPGGSIPNFTDRESKEEPNKKHEGNRNFYYSSLPYRDTTDKLEEYLYTFLDSHYIDKENILTILNRNMTFHDKNNIQEKVSSLSNKLYYELSQEIKPIVNELYKVLHDNKELIPHIIRIEAIHEYFSLIQIHSRDLLSQDFINEYILSYYDKKGNIRRGRGFDSEQYITFIKKNYPHLKDDLDKRIAETRSSQINNLASIYKLISKVQEVWSPEDAEILNSIDAKTYEDYIENSDDFFYDSIEFLKTRSYTNDFSDAASSIKKALNNLKAKGEDYDWRISRLLEKNNIKIEEEKE